MKRVAVVVAVVSVLALAQGVNAADLEAGWYAIVRSVSIFTYDHEGMPELRGGGWFVTDPGSYGPFQVTDEPRGDEYSRGVRVLEDAAGVLPGTGVELPLATGLYEDEVIAYLGVDWQTDYDASQMRLELIQRDEQTGAVDILWQQDQSGALWHYEYMAWDTYPVGLAFRVLAVPEPCTFGTVAILLSVTVLRSGARRRSR